MDLDLLLTTTLATTNRTRQARAISAVCVVVSGSSPSVSPSAPVGTSRAPRFSPKSKLTMTGKWSDTRAGSYPWKISTSET